MKSQIPPFFYKLFSGRTLSHKKYPFTGDFGNTHAVPPTPEWGGGGGGWGWNDLDPNHRGGAGRRRDRPCGRPPSWSPSGRGRWCCWEGKPRWDRVRRCRWAGGRARSHRSRSSHYSRSSGGWGARRERIHQRSNSCSARDACTSAPCTDQNGPPWAGPGSRRKERRAATARLSAGRRWWIRRRIRDRMEGFRRRDRIMFAWCRGCSPIRPIHEEWSFPARKPRRAHGYRLPMCWPCILVKCQREKTQAQIFIKFSFDDTQFLCIYHSLFSIFRAPRIAWKLWSHWSQQMKCTF